MNVTVNLIDLAAIVACLITIATFYFGRKKSAQMEQFALSKQALDYLFRKGLQGSPARDTALTQIESEKVVEG